MPRYLQQANEINALYGQKDHPWQTDGADSTGFGVAPNFGCCTANMQQGWPKYVNNLLLEDAKGGVVVAMLAPVKATLTSGATIEVVTNYPFGDNATIAVSGDTTVSVRIPGWASDASISVNKGVPTPAKNGTMVAVPCTGSTSIYIHLNPEVRVEVGWGAYAKPGAPYVVRMPCCLSLKQQAPCWVGRSVALI